MTHKEFAVGFLRDFHKIGCSHPWLLIVFMVADVAFLWFLITADESTVAGLFLCMMIFIVIIPFLPSSNKDGAGTTEATAAPVEKTEQ